MEPRNIQMTTYQIVMQAQEAWHHFAAARYLDAFDAATCATFLAYYAMLLTPDGVDVYHRVADLRAECRWKLRELPLKAATQ